MFGEIAPPATHPHLDSNYSLSVMSTEAYVRDPRFEAHGAAIKWSPDHPAKWYDERQLRQVLKDEDWSDVFLIAWHAQFDGLILTHHYGVHPKMWGCPMSMARMLSPAYQSVSLDNVRKLLGMPGKSTPYNLFRGKHWHEMSPDTQQQVAAGAEDEVESIWTLFKHFAQTFPAEEYEVLDEVIRMFVDPVLQADSELLAKIWEEEDAAKSRRLADLAVDAGDLQSSDRFADLLRAEGVEPETKPGKPKPDGSPKFIYAFAKTDDFMRDLQDHASERVRTLVEARLGAKSTILQTRAETLGWMATRGPLCVYLRYCGASTLRPTGGDECLTADTRVLVFDWQKGLTKKRIVDILLDDLIWDGEAFVAHGGVAFRGYREVIEHDGIEGTPDHVVFTARGEISLEEAAQTRARILDCESPHSWQVVAAARGNHNACSMPLPVRTRKANPVQRAKKR